MPSFSQPSFQDRIALANKARDKALKKLKAKPQPTEAELAERKTAHEAKEAAKAAKRAEKLAEREKVKAEKEARKAG